MIVGGGVSGLAAAVHLCSRGLPPLLLEQKPSLGGRAYSFTDLTTGDMVDNGQHVLIAGYRRTMDFLKAIGTIDLLSIQSQPELVFHDPLLSFQRFSIPQWSRRLGLAATILRGKYFSFADRCRVLRAGRNLLRENPERWTNLTIEQWMERNGQSDQCRKSFWDPLAISMMNEFPERASAAPFLRAVRETFLQSWHNARLAIPKVGLSQLYVEPAGRCVLKNGGKVVCNADVVQVLLTESRVGGVRLRDGSEIECNALILCVPPYRLQSLIPPELLRRMPMSPLDEFAYSPIVSTHLWFETDLMEFDFVGLVGRKTQWIFNKRRLLMEPGKGGHISAVISAAYDIVSLSNDEIIRLTIDDLRSVFGSQMANPRHTLVIREKRATISLTPEAESRRPSQKTAIENLFLAGDWTDTGYPATIEGAVLSGERSAELARAYCGG